MLQKFYRLAIRSPWLVILLVLGLTVFFASQIGKLRWETDARVYMPKGHPAIIYDEKVEHIFGAKDALIITLVNDQEGIFNRETLARIDRVTTKVAALPGVIANRLLDVASLSTASVFVGTEDSIGAERLMPEVPTNDQAIAKLKETVFANADIFVGNLVSGDGKAAMIRAKLKEGATTRYETFFAIRSIISQETGDWSWSQGSWSGGGGGQWGGNQWQKTSEPSQPVGSQSNPDASGAQQQGGAGNWPANGQWPQSSGEAGGAGTKWQAQWGGGENTSAVSAPLHDKFYLAGRPVLEVTSGLEAMNDLAVMVPTLLLVIAVMLLFVFRSGRGVLLPIFVMAAGVVWTMGSMAVLDVPLYTISTMMPVILVAVGIGDAIHLLSRYYDVALQDPHRDRKAIVGDVMSELGAPLITTSLTTAIGFLSLWFAEMPPFKVFGLFTVLGIGYCWLLSVTFLPAVLSLMQPKVSGYLKKRKNLRVHQEADRLSYGLVKLGEALLRRPRVGVIAIALVSAVSLIGATRLFVDSSWMSDFRSESELAQANALINDRFSGTINLNIVIDGRRDDALKSPDLLKAMESLQKHIETLPYVGDTLSLVDYLKSMNKNLHGGQKDYDALPDDQAQIAEYLFLFSISGRPEELDEVADFGYRQANIEVRIKSDHTKVLRAVIDNIRGYVAEHFAKLDVDVNYAGSGNNSYLWADMLIRSQTSSILLSKVGILVAATLLFRSFVIGLLVVAPVSITTLLIAAVAGVARVPLDVSTALAAGLAIGVGVDYAVHYIYRYLRQRRENKSHGEATGDALRTVGRTIVFNAVVVTAGFAVLLFSRFPPHVKLGEFVAGYMVISCLAALLTLPVLLSFVRGRVLSNEADAVA